MRASLPHTLRERRRSRADQHRRGAAATPAAPSSGAATAPAAVEAPVADQAAQRVREAGGPIDEAAYVCECGFMFRAAVSTTVACPHCSAPQAW
jgi:hypothetical protein